MKLSELVEKLRKDLAERGDCDVCVEVEWGGYDDDVRKTSDPWRDVSFHRATIEHHKMYNVIIIKGSA